MIMAIIYDIRWFLVVLAVAVCAVANFYFLLLNDQRVCFPGNDEVGCDALVSRFSNPGDALFTITKMLLLGGYDLGFYEPSQYYVALQLIFSFTMIFVVIVLLNLLIALMGASVGRIAENAEMEVAYLRTAIIAEVEIFMSDKEKANERNFPPYLHVLVPKTVATKLSAEENIKELDKKLDNNKQELDKKLDNNKQELDKKLDNNKHELAKLDKKMEEVAKLMEQLTSRITYPHSV